VSLNLAHPVDTAKVNKIQRCTVVLFVIYCGIQRWKTSQLLHKFRDR